MDYRIETFNELVKEVEGQGGAILAEKCLPEEVIYEEGRHAVPDSYTCGCNNFSRLTSPYESEGDKVGFVTACAVCDNVGAWPRYEDVVKSSDSTYWDEMLEDEDDE